MIQSAIQQLKYLCDTIPQLLLEIDEASFALKLTPDKWSKKEIIGHLIDSATNNHQRFVRGQFEEIPFIVYDQNNWNTYSYYQQMDGRQLIHFWTLYNQHLLALIQLIPEDRLSRKVNTGGKDDLTLAYLINDYVAHLEHHLHQIVAY